MRAENSETSNPASVRRQRLVRKAELTDATLGARCVAALATSPAQAQSNATLAFAAGRARDDVFVSPEVSARSEMA
jgi:streptogramin lyase